MGESIIGTTNLSLLSSSSSDDSAYNIIAIPLYQLESKSNGTIKLQQYTPISTGPVDVFSFPLANFPIRAIRALFVIDEINPDIGPESLLANGSFLTTLYDANDLSKMTLTINQNKVFEDITIYQNMSSMTSVSLDNVNSVFSKMDITSYVRTGIAFSAYCRKINSIEDAYTSDTPSAFSNIVALTLASNNDDIGTATGFTGYAAVCVFLVVYYA